jgi:hypothetical protein
MKMMTKGFFPLLVAVLLTPSDAAVGQAVFPEENGQALKGVQAVDAIVEIQTWLGMTGDRDRLEQNIQSAFALGLRRDRVRVDSSAANYLFCELKFAEASGLVAYSYDLAYYSFELSGVHRLLWTTGGIVTVGRSNFTPEAVAKTCVDAFANEWLRWNPR